MSKNVQPTVFVGIDWGSAAHQVCVFSSESKILGEKEFPHSGNGLCQMVDWILCLACCDAEQACVAIEVPHGPIVDTLMDRNFQVFSINPKQLDRFRDRFSPAGAKDDRRDARVLASALRTDPQCFRKLDPVDAKTVQLREASRRADDFTLRRTTLTHQLRGQLWRYFPQFPELKADIFDAWLLELWLLVRTPERARRVRISSVEKVMKKHRIRRFTPEQVLQILRSQSMSVAPGVVDAAVYCIEGLVKELQFVEDQLREAKQLMNAILEPMKEPVTTAAAEKTVRSDDTPKASSDNQDTPRERFSNARILASIPGIGPTVLAILLSEAPNLIEEHALEALRCLCGIAPVTKRSGKMYRVLQRKACSKRLRNAAYHWSRVAIQHDPISKAKYQALRARGHSHGRALRSVADRLLCVACAMLRDGTLFDPTRKSVALRLAA